MKDINYCFGLFIDGLLVDETNLDESNPDHAEDLFLNEFGWKDKIKGRHYQIIHMTDNTDEVDIGKFFDEGLCPNCESVDYERVDDMSQHIGHDWKQIQVDFHCHGCQFSWSLLYKLEDY